MTAGIYQRVADDKVYAKMRVKILSARSMGGGIYFSGKEKKLLKKIMENLNEVT